MKLVRRALIPTAVFFSVLSCDRKDVNATTSNNGTQANAPAVTILATTYTLADVQKHNTPADCWIIIDNGVYNVTAFLTDHPGGANSITKYCGKDATTAFNRVGHSSEADTLKANYKVGTLSAAANMNSIPANPVTEPAPANPVTEPAPANPVTEPAPANPVTEPAPANPVTEPAPAPTNEPAPTPIVVPTADPVVVPTIAPTAEPTVAPTPVEKTFAWAEISLHNTETNCWIVINTDVCDVTSFLTSHPGGRRAIIKYCGKDATTAFDNVGHSNDAQQLVTNYRIGKLVP